MSSPALRLDIGEDTESVATLCNRYAVNYDCSTDSVIQPQLTQHYLYNLKSLTGIGNLKYDKEP